MDGWMDIWINCKSKIKTTAIAISPYFPGHRVLISRDGTKGMDRSRARSRFVDRSNGPFWSIFFGRAGA